MDMDDPWGSPWADDIHINHQPRAKEDEVRPTTLATETILAAEGKTTSPWGAADDDAFGDWTGFSADDGNGLEVDGASKDHERDIEGYGKLENNLSASLAGWDDEAVLSGEPVPSSERSISSKSVVLARQPSPDPWGTKGVLDVQESIHTEHTNHEGANATVADTLHQEKHSPAPVKHITTDDAVLVAEDSQHELSIAKDERDDTPDPSPPKEESEATLPISQKPGDVQQADFVSSRPSSSPSERSRPDEVPTDSPRTSFDEEPKRADPLKETPSKVQELVEHFDGLAKKETGEPTESIEDSTQRTEEIEVAGEENDMDDDDDFGDFEEGLSDAEESVFGNKLEDVKIEGVSDKAPAAATQQGESLPKHALPKDFGPVEFKVNTSLLDDLFSDAGEPPSSEKAYIPDKIPHDPFSSVEQRKIWYRISRYGPMRKHNTGDDENYVRVSWRESRVREETLKIVARWMEEDRISGRVVLGGSSKGSTIFGWNDGKSTPVPLADAFSSRREGKAKGPTAAESLPEVPREWPKGLVRKSSTSKSRSSSKVRRRSSTRAPVASEEIKLVTSIPEANFGWNTIPASTILPSMQAIAPLSAPKPKAVARVTESFKGSGSSLHRSSSSSVQSRPKAMVHKRSESENTNGMVTNHPSLISLKPITHTPTSLQTVHKPIPILPSLATSEDLAEDDDWGEMVSSPMTSTAPVFPMASFIQPTRPVTYIEPTPVRQHTSPIKTVASPPTQSPWTPHGALGSPLSLQAPIAPTIKPAVLPTTQSPWNPQVATFEAPTLQAPIAPAIKSVESFDVKTVVSPPTQSPWDTQEAATFNLGPTLQSPVTASNSIMDAFKADPVLTAPARSMTDPFPNGSAVAIPPLSAAIDPWASADFSFFDTVSPPKKPAPQPVAKTSPLKSVTFNTPAVPPPPRKDYRTRDEIEQDRIVNSVIKGLPDLSYMLRR